MWWVESYCSSPPLESIGEDSCVQRWPSLSGDYHKVRYGVVLRSQKQASVCGAAHLAWNVMSKWVWSLGSMAIPPTKLYSTTLARTGSAGGQSGCQSTPPLVDLNAPFDFAPYPLLVKSTCGST